MTGNGEAQYTAPDLKSAYELLLRHYEYTYVAPGERAARRRPTTDPVARDVTTVLRRRRRLRDGRAICSPRAPTPGARSRSRFVR